MFVYTIQPVVKPVWQPVWQPCWTNSHCSFHTVVKPSLTAVLNEQLFVQLVVKQGCTTGLTTGCIHDTTGCQTKLVCNRLYRVEQTATVRSTGWTNSGCSFNTIQPVVKPVWQPVVSCKRGSTMPCSLMCILVHGQLTIIFVVSVGLSVCLCRVFLSRLWSDFDQTRTYVIYLGLVVSRRI